MAIRIESPAGTDDLTEFILFHDQVYRTRGARWPAHVPFQLPTLAGQGPYARERRLHPFVAREDGNVVARALAVVDGHYQRHWGERLGHVTMFEALPGTTDATRLMMDAACAWLAEQGAEDARTGYGLLDFPFVIDDYEALPPSWLRQNPAYYHALLKDAGFETEQGWVDYRITVGPELVARWERMREATRRAGFEVVRLADLPEARRVPQLTTLWNEAFARHWGYTPFTEAEMATVVDVFAATGMLDATFLAYQAAGQGAGQGARQGREAVGALWYLPDVSRFATLAPGRTLTASEQLNVLAIAVRAPARGRGLNLGMAAHAYLDSVRQGASHLSYTLVLDHNWPSRRTAEKLGATVCANYVTYRRHFARR